MADEIDLLWDGIHELRVRAQWRWPVSLPLCRPIGNGLWEIRTDLPTKRTARVLLCLCDEILVALHGFVKKTRAMPDDDLALAQKRKKELEQGRTVSTNRIMHCDTRTLVLRAAAHQKTRLTAIAAKQLQFFAIRLEAKEEKPHREHL